MFEKIIFAERLKVLRNQKNITTVVLAKETGLSKQAISQFENASNYPHCKTIIALADYFNVSIDYLVGRSDDPKRY